MSAQTEMQVREERRVLPYDPSRVEIWCNVWALPRRFGDALDALRERFPADAEVVMTGDTVDGWMDIWWEEDARPEETEAFLERKRAEEAEARDRAEFEAWRAERPAVGATGDEPSR